MDKLSLVQAVIEVCKLEVDNFTPKSNNYQSGIKTNPWRIALFLCDFRHERGNGREILSLFIPTIKYCTKFTQGLRAPTLLTPIGYDLEPDKLGQPKIQLRWKKLEELTMDIGLNDALRSKVVSGIKSCFPSLYRGDGEFLRDYSMDEDKEMEKKKLAKTHKLVDEGRVIGPWTRPPFPNSWCDKQALVCRTFCIPKNSLTPEDGLIRIIFDKSYLSINSITPRADSGTPYYTFKSFLDKVANAGRGCLFSWPMLRRRTSW